ncbi:MAG: hypothetical protein SGILL_003807 [Bacillariaceae sp.]
MALFPFPEGEILGRSDQVDWSATTERQIRNSMSSSEIDPPVIIDNLRTSIEVQIPPGSGTAIASGNSTQRLLQGDVESILQPDALNIVFEVFIDFRSVSKDQDVDSWVFNAFDTSLDRAEYVLDLQQKSSTFNPVEDVETTVEGYDPPPTQAPSSGGNGANVAVIVGASVGGTALVTLIVLLVMRRRKGKGSIVGALDDRQTHTSPTTQPQNVKVSTEILVEPQDDVSTLGDPMFGAGMMMNNVEKDEATAT